MVRIDGKPRCRAQRVPDWLWGPTIACAGITRIADAQPTAPILTEDGRLCFSAGNRLIMLHTKLRPASSAWPMTRADAQRSGRTVASCRILTCGWSLDGELELRFAGQAGGVSWSRWLTSLRRDA
jgi:hypothetical protein